MRGALNKYRFPDGQIVSVRASYYPASCNKCGWQGSSEDCGTCEADDVYCPKCHASGADCGRAGEAAEKVV